MKHIYLANNKWIPRSPKEKSLTCPKCNSARWDKEPRKKKKK